ncbi:uncharacterized protein BX664DRAFT_339399 [Halteromyces radiatus]|uniref:uncharacterized protein n=1 Tax=Halteromyces radiatus TaxID=101107 RepID=UPI00221F7EBD|nr:uncharacterized protein BX664DRAFT_339399 [Halteromyces radiatus]KAI8082914.1 hypothetical protein BX664DRAFT_339399 [Halteromyces radiatus]
MAPTGHSEHKNNTEDINEQKKSGDGTNEQSIGDQLDETAATIEKPKVEYDDDNLTTKHNNDISSTTTTTDTIEGDGSNNTASEEDINAAWTEAWDDQSQAYYWWNTITYESSWENPNESTSTETTTQSQQVTTKNELDSVLDTIDTEVKAKLDGAEKSNNDQGMYDQYYQYNTSVPTTSDHLGATDPYRFQAFFNTKTGRFQTAGDVAQRNPEQYTIEARGRRQMEHYFDVDAYQASRNQERQQQQGKKRTLSKKEIERFKRAKKEKKANRMRGWLMD